MQRDISIIKRELLEFRRKLPHGAINNIAKEARIGQSSVSRILNGEFSIVNSNVIKICKYAQIPIKDNVKTGSFQNITEQLLELWDGSAEMESALLELMQGLKHLRKVT